MEQKEIKISRSMLFVYCLHKLGGQECRIGKIGEEAGSHNQLTHVT